MARITVLGECMVELSPEGEGLHRMGFAGDTFNAAYLSSRLAGLPIETAVARGHDLAAAVVSCKGAIIPPTSMPVWSRG